MVCVWRSARSSDRSLDAAGSTLLETRPTAVNLR
jgi:hypothetical protein